MISGIQHVAIEVADLGEAIAFYAKLGLEEVPRPQSLDDLPGAWLQVGAHQVHLMVNEELERPRTLGHVAFQVGDLDGVRHILAERGVETTEPFDNGDGRQCFANDPSGNLLELNEG